MRSRPGTLASLLLLATALVGGPGLTLSEAWQHSHRAARGHPHSAHFETRGGQDHNDRCEIGLISAPARAPAAGSAELHLPAPEPKAWLQHQYCPPAEIAGLLPPSRAPPAVL